MNLPKFNNPNLLKQSLTHRSAVNEGKGESHNERLEFLGDAVLELVISEFVYLKFPDFQEGKLTQFRTALVRTETLAKLANELNIPKSIFISKGEKKEGGEYNASLLADTIEAVIGSIFLDKGLDAAKKFIYSTLLVDADKKIKTAIMLDSKSKLQEIVQAKGFYSPTYNIVDISGPDHQRIFTAEVVVNGKPAASGKGASKQEAEQEAAKAALDDIIR
ncbi:ribonuclease III [Candidatus Collierbacteria bacterium]|nr:ribonuclease III [Candidatus Collierbacteria bacterium]